MEKLIDDTEEVSDIRNLMNREASGGITSGLIPTPDKELIETGEFRSLIYEVKESTFYKFTRIDETNRLVIFSSDGIPICGKKVKRIVHSVEEQDTIKFFVEKGVTHILIYISANNRKTYPLVRLEKC